MNKRQEIEMISAICDSILSMNKMENFLVERIVNVKHYFKEETKAYIEILSDNITEFNLKIAPELKTILEEIKIKYEIGAPGALNKLV